MDADNDVATDVNGSCSCGVVNFGIAVSTSVNYINKNNHSLLATTLLNPFSQGNMDANKRVQFNMDVNNDVVANIADSCSRGAVNFGIVVSTSFKYKGRYDHFRRVRHLKVVCEPLSFITSEGHLNGTSNWVLVHGLTCH
ncbi:hypothetical protein MTR_4g011410 [Medicago truncatula]|uniref:Uncharacterized protein n=1 Tax=Medicago truncatula TaxID=3880 RepID=A0A072UHX5_MEDTR|nr:hypothetical protein MTR_4g011410 [Medicago truncatula]